MVRGSFEGQSAIGRGAEGAFHKHALSQLWRLIEELATREGALVDVLNRYARESEKFLPNASDVPAECRALLSFVEEKFASKRCYVDVGDEEYSDHELYYEPFEDDEAREVAKAIVDLTFSVTMSAIGMVEHK